MEENATIAALKQRIEHLERTLERRTKELTLEMEDCIRITLELEKREKILDQKVRELNSIVQLARLTATNAENLDEFVPKALGIIAAAYCCDGDTFARVKIGSRLYSNTVKNLPTVQISRNIKSEGKSLGKLSVHRYLVPGQDVTPAFTKVERLLLNVLANSLATIIKHINHFTNLIDFREAISLSNSMILLSDINRVVTYASDHFLQVTECPPEDIVGNMKYIYAMRDRNVKTFEELINSVQSTGRWTGRMVMLSLSGREIIAQGTVSTIYKNGMPDRYVSVYEDITELVKLNEKAFRQNEEYRTVVENIPQGIYIIDVQGKLLFLNRFKKNFYKSPVDSPIGLPVHKLFPEPLADQIINKIDDAKESKESFTIDLEFLVKDQPVYYNALMQPLLNEQKEVTSVMFITTDITMKKRNELLIGIQHQVDSLTNITTDVYSSMKMVFKSLLEIDWIDGGGIYLLNGQGDRIDLVYDTGLSDNFISQVSSYPYALHTVDEMKLRSPRYFNEEDFGDFGGLYKAERLTFVATLPLFHSEVLIGSLNLASRSVSRIEDFDKGILESIAARIASLIVFVETREQLARSNDQLNQKLHELSANQQVMVQKSRLESLGELTAGLAHEINQPLSVITLVMENIQNKKTNDLLSPGYLPAKFGSINQNLNRIKDLIDHVRVFSRDQGRVMFERIDVNQGILNALSLMNMQLKSKNINVITDLGENLGFTIGNPSRFEQIVLNLLSNSKDAILEKQAQAFESKALMEIRLTTRLEDNRIIFRAWDNGTGISAGNLEKLFNPFFTTKGEDHGTGLGLPIVYGIVREMEGEISVKSEYGSFTEFSIVFPQYRLNF